jgi:hypothetical protein
MPIANGGSGAMRRFPNGMIEGVPRKPTPGQVVQIPLDDGRFAYGRVDRDATVRFYRQVSSVPGRPPVGSRDFAFCVGVYGDVLAGWECVGTDPFDSDDAAWPPASSIQDPITSRWSVYERGSIRPAEAREAEPMESAAVWDERHLLPRLAEAVSDS